MEEDEERTMEVCLLQEAGEVGWSVLAWWFLAKQGLYCAIVDLGGGSALKYKGPQDTQILHLSLLPPLLEITARRSWEAADAGNAAPGSHCHDSKTSATVHEYGLKRLHWKTSGFDAQACISRQETPHPNRASLQETRPNQRRSERHGF